MYFFDLEVRRGTRSVDLHDEILKEAAAAEKAGYREIFGKTSHGLKEIAEHKDFDFVKVHWSFRTADNSAKVLFHAILYTTDTQ